MHTGGDAERLKYRTGRRICHPRTPLSHMKTRAPATATAAAIGTALLAHMAHAIPIAEPSASVTPMFGSTPAKHGAMSRTGIIVLVVVVGFVLAFPATLYFCVSRPARTAGHMLNAQYIRKWARLRREELAGDKPLPPTEAAPFLPTVRESLASAWQPVATVSTNARRGVATAWSQCAETIRGAVEGVRGTMKSSKTASAPRPSLQQLVTRQSDDTASIMSYDSAAPSYRSEEIPRYTFVDPFAPYIQMAFPSGNLSLEDVVSRV